MDNIRSFIAIPISSDVCNIIANVQSKLKAQWPQEVKWVETKNIHITIEFLGDMPSDQIPHIANTMTTVLQNTPQFEISLQGIGAFPHTQSPRVIWIGIADVQNYLTKTNQLISSAMRQFGVEPEEHYSPHITLGRVRQHTHLLNAQSFLEQMPQNTLAQIHVQRVVLFKSTLRQDGPSYEVLAETKLI